MHFIVNYSRVIYYEIRNPMKCIIFSLIISPLLPVSTMTTSTKAYRMQFALAELKQQEKPNILTTSKNINLSNLHSITVEKERLYFMQKLILNLNNTLLKLRRRF